MTNIAIACVLCHAGVCVGQANYGKDDEAAVAAVKAVYNDLELQRAFLEYEQDSYEILIAAIDKQNLLPRAVFTTFLQKIYKRTK